MLSFIHLSDIHFRKYSGDPYDIDEDLRNELIYDISHCLTKQIATVDGVLICGDIAFSGKAEEYEAATDFLDKICDSLKLDKSRIFCVPGNHDIDQSVTKGVLSVKLLQSKLESTETLVAYSEYLGQVFRNSQDAEMLYAPIACYNEKFAAQYGCSLVPDKLVWKQDIKLNDDYNLCLIGINSTIISNEEDRRSDGTERPMRIVSMQIPNRKDGTIYLSLCHHPPECWVDPEHKLITKMNERVAIQLYGHKHLQKIQKTEKGLIVGSGATHPSRFEAGWIPRYNWITLDLKLIDRKTVLEIKIYSRVLDKMENKFEPDKTNLNGKEYEEFTINLMEQDSANMDEIMPEVEQVVEPLTLSVHSWERDFIYSFMNLPFFCRQSILKKLKLDRLEDEGVKHIELLDNIIYRAKEQNCVVQLLKELDTERERMEK